MKRAGDALKTLSLRFQQKKHDRILNEDEATAGKLEMELPGRIRWEYDPPDGKVLLVKDDKLQVYNPRARQVQELKRGQMKGPEGDLLVGFGRSNGALPKKYEVSILREEGTRVTLKLVPRDAATATFTSIELTVDKERFLPVRTRFTEPNDDTVDLIFSDLAVNAPIPKSRFELKLPAGVEVVREHE